MVITDFVGILEAEVEGVHYYFIDNEYYFSGSKVYSDDQKWEIERYAFFSKAVLSALPVIGFRPEVLHCHDWQTGLIPVYLKERFQDLLQSMLVLHLLLTEIYGIVLLYNIGICLRIEFLIIFTIPTHCPIRYTLPVTRF